MPTTDTTPNLVPDAVPEEEPVRDWWVMIGMTIAAASAAVASFTGLYGLAAVAGWPVRLAWLLPITIDAHAMTSARVWLATSTRSVAARRFARTNALGAIATSIAGNAAYHAIGAGLLEITWPIIVLVGAVPAAVLGLTAHLHALRGRVDQLPMVENHPRNDDGPQGGSVRDQDGTQEKGVPPARAEPSPRRTTRRVRRRPPARSDEELVNSARIADAQHRELHGRPITRDALRIALQISTPRATEIRRLLQEPAKSDADPDAVPQPLDLAAQIRSGEPDEP